jgi:hypothetical protein
MALVAYALVPALDLDARFCIGMLALMAGGATVALAQADTIRHAVPSHLFGLVLRAHARDLKRDTHGAFWAFRTFLQREAAERARRRPEYEDAARDLTAFHTEAAERAATEVTRGR